MKIKEFFIRRYGPLGFANQFKLGNFTLFWGKNEAGKTLTIEALIKLLFYCRKGSGQRRWKIFSGIERVEEYPEGYIVLAHSQGKETVVKEGKDSPFVKRKDLETIARIYRNVFIIRNSDLMVEDKFYDTAIERIANVRTKDFKDLRDKIRKMVNLTDKNNFKNTDSDQYLRSRIEKAEMCIRDIEEVIQRIKSEGLDKVEEKIIILEKELDGIVESIRKLEEAEKRRKFQRGREYVESLEKIFREWEKLKDFSDEELEKWNRLEKEMGELQAVQSEKQKKEAELEEKIVELKKRKKEVESQLQTLEGKESRMEQLKEECNEYFTLERLYTPKIGKLKIYNPGLVVSVILLFLSFFALFLLKNLAILAFAGLFTLSSIVLAVLSFDANRSKSELKLREKRILSRAYKLGIEENSIMAIEREINNFLEKLDTLRDEKGNTEKILQGIEEEIDRLRREEIRKLKERLIDVESKLEGIKKRLGITSREELEDKVKQRRNLETEMEKLKSRLAELYGSPQSAELQDCVRWWKDKVKEYSVYEKAEEKIQFDEKKKDELEEKREQLDKELKNLRGKWDGLKGDLKQIEREVQSILLEGVYCNSVNHLDDIKRRLEDFVEHHYRQRENALECFKILDEIEREEKEELSKIFGPGSEVSHIFKEITGGNYNAVHYDKNNNRLYAENKDGTVLDIENLSAGTIDQLYFAVRFALARELLKENEGFFILDDPFIKSDPERLSKQLDMLKRFVEQYNWQIIYFSCKGEVKEALKEEIKQGKVVFYELSPIFSRPEQNKLFQ